MAKAQKSVPETVIAQGWVYPRGAVDYRKQLRSTTSRWKQEGLCPEDGIRWHQAGLGAQEAIR